MTDLTFEKFRQTNLTRCENDIRPIDEWSPTDWACSLAGEVGEICNEIKKMRRLANSPESISTLNSEQYYEYRQRKENCRGEIADALSYLDLLATRLGFRLEDCLIDKFNEVSERHKSNIKL